MARLRWCEGSGDEGPVFCFVLFFTIQIIGFGPSPFRFLSFFIYLFSYVNVSVLLKKKNPPHEVIIFLSCLTKVELTLSQKVELTLSQN